MNLRGSQERYPTLTARQHWGKYVAGMATSVAFISVLTLVGFLMAVVATAVYR